eukprot:358582-Chlamydomonas_euryale.AAC.2
MPSDTLGAVGASRTDVPAHPSASWAEILNRDIIPYRFASHTSCTSRCIPHASCAGPAEAVSLGRDRHLGSAPPTAATPTTQQLRDRTGGHRRAKCMRFGRRDRARRG